MMINYVIKDAWVFMTFRQCFEKRDVAVAGEKFYCISPAISYPGVKIIDGSGMYMIPGLIDIHMHIESSMTYPREFSRITLPHGTTTVVADAHEIANVFGMEGIAGFMDQETELDIFYAIPSSVPATSERLETAGASIGEEEVERLAEDSRVLCLGEVMNFKDLTSQEDTLIKRLVKICSQGKLADRKLRIEGHCPKITGEDLCRFIYEGVDADHTQQTPESVVEKADLGMFLELQHKSLTPQVVEAVCINSLYENAALITDDTMPDQLLKGQLNRIVRQAVLAGMPVEKAIYCATYTPARRMHLDDRGLIGPGKLADFVLLEDLDSFEPAAVFKSGECVYGRGRWEREVRTQEMQMQEMQAREMQACESKDGEPQDGEQQNVEQQNREPKPQKPGFTQLDGLHTYFPEHFYHSVHCRRAVLSDFKLMPARPCSRVRVNVMKIHSFGTATDQVVRDLEVRDGEICWQEAGLSLAVLFERHGKNGNIAYGLVAGAFKAPGAAAATWSHDSHNLLVVGTSLRDMVLAQNRVIDLQGGYVAARDGQIRAEACLKVGGILSDGPLEQLAEALGQVRQEMRNMGYDNNNEIMSMSTLSLPVSPSLKLTDFGLLDVKTQQRVGLIEEYLD